VISSLQHFCKEDNDSCHLNTAFKVTVLTIVQLFFERLNIVGKDKAKGKSVKSTKARQKAKDTSSRQAGNKRVQDAAKEAGMPRDEAHDLVTKDPGTKNLGYTELVDYFKDSK